MRIFAKRALLPNGWASNVAIVVDASGLIAGATPDDEPRATDEVVETLLPGMANLHSHAFQRAMAGRAERPSASGDDDFWTWRQAMYDLAATLDPDALHAIAVEAYRGMLRAGYTSVTEFHYLHRDPAGAWYAEKGAMAKALVEAARQVGLPICLLPVLYAHANARGEPLADEQRRFETSVDDVLETAAELRRSYAGDPAVAIGVAAHSLRAVSPDELRALVEGSPRDVPVHLHIAEQEREVEEVCATLGARPVEWLLDRFEVDGRWSLVHATHAEPHELEEVASRGAVVAICPTTEANLGDGIFALPALLRAGGRFGIGSDSNVSFSPAEELRLLEYGQRLSLRRRVVASAMGRSCGETLYGGAAAGGTCVSGFSTGMIVRGMRADFVTLKTIAAATRPEDALDRYIFVDGAPGPEGVMIGGRWRVRDKEFV
ncbi:MAG TPA: formimidoylglutamate deiminase [Candidatus Acidoferrales bacterium]|nr:formimidoylglutamate deiminase [Candidatus Acidoferrales bacterium]